MLTGRMVPNAFWDKWTEHTIYYRGYRIAGRGGRWEVLYGPGYEFHLGYYESEKDARRAVDSDIKQQKRALQEHKKQERAARAEAEREEKARRFRPAGTYKGYRLEKSSIGWMVPQLDTTIFDDKHEAQRFIDSEVGVSGNPKRRMRIYDVYWSPTGQKIATVTASTAKAAKKKAPEPYRRRPGEIYVEDRGPAASSNPSNPSNHGLIPAKLKRMPNGAIKVFVSPNSARRLNTAFDDCVAAVEAKGGAYDPRAVCAKAGMRKYGKKRFLEMARAGKRRVAARRKR